MFHIALYQPSIPPNTGNIGRMCVGLGCELHLIGPCQFDFTDKRLRRAGLDYWPHLQITLHAHPEGFLDWLGPRKPWLSTKHGACRFDQADYQPGEVLIFGNEVSGLPTAWRERWTNRCLSIPIQGSIRSFNLANAVAMILGMAMSRSGAFDQNSQPRATQCAT